VPPALLPDVTVDVGGQRDDHGDFLWIQASRSSSQLFVSISRCTFDPSRAASRTWRSLAERVVAAFYNPARHSRAIHQGGQRGDQNGSGCRAARSPPIRCASSFTVIRSRARTCHTLILHLVVLSLRAGLGAFPINTRSAPAVPVFYMLCFLRFRVPRASRITVL